MEIKYSSQGYLIYSAILLYLAAFITALTSSVNSRISGFLRKIAILFFFLGFAAALSAFIYRWQHVRHVPMQNLFEVFLTLGMIVFPIWIVGKKAGIQAFASDMLLGAIVLVPAGFVFSAEPQRLPPALQCWLFSPHVAVYMLSYMLMAKAAIQGAFCLVTFADDKESYEKSTYVLIRIGFPLLTLGLILGSWWGQMAWGHWWGWDPKELWSLASWLIYLLYFHIRYMFGPRKHGLLSIIAILGLVVIIVTLIWVNLSSIFEGLHSYAK